MSQRTTAECQRPLPTLSHMSTRKPTRVSQNEVDERINELVILDAELASQGKTLSIQDIRDRYGVSSRQAQRYKKRVFERTRKPLEKDQGYQIAQSLLSAVPMINRVLNDDLQRLNSMSGETEGEELALIKARRDQAQAIFRFGSQILKELRELGLVSKANEEVPKSDPTFADLASDPEITSQLQAEVERELEEFARELEATESQFV